jgi:DNA-binding response OmpR family regulator
MSDEVLNLKTKSRLSHEALTREKTPRVLLAEDNNDMRKLLALSLRKYGYEVIECADGRQLLNYISSFFFPYEETEVFQLIISDIRMPGFTGLEVLERMHNCKAFPPMVLITAFGDEEIHAQARRFGAAAIFDKPFDIDELMDKVQAIVPF